MRSILRNGFIGVVALLGMGYLTMTASAQIIIDYHHHGRSVGLIIGDYPPPCPDHRYDYPPPRPNHRYDCPPPRYEHHGMYHTYRNSATGEYRRVAPNGHTTYRPFYGHPVVEQPFPGHPYIAR